MTNKIDTQKADTDVVIVGMGPTGLTLAHFLARRDINVVILEKEPEFYGNARAVYTDDECLRIYQDAGITEELTKDMVQEIPYQFVLPNDEVLAQYMPKKRPNHWPISNLFYQPYLETTLTDLLDQYPNISIRRGREVVRFEQDANSVTVYHAQSNGSNYGKHHEKADVAEGITDAEAEPLTAKYLVGSDGGRSVVRSELDIKMTGKSYPNPWLVVDIKAKEGEECFRHLPYFNFYCTPECPTVSCRQPNGHHRFEFMLMPGQTKEYMEDPATIRKYLSKYVDVDKIEILRSLVYTFNALIAEKWREGRIILAGDAAHMTPQFIGQGMNAGVRDAYNLAWKLSGVIKGDMSDKILDSYQSERYDHAKAMIDLAVHVKSFVSMTNPVAAMTRNGIIKFLNLFSTTRDYLRELGLKPKPAYTNGEFLGLDRSKRSSVNGKLIPQPRVLDHEGRVHLFDDVMGDDFVLVGHGVDPRETLSRDQLKVYEKLNTRYIALYDLGRRPQNNVQRFTPEGLIELEDMDGYAINWFKSAGLCNNAVAIIRPDKFAFAAVKNTELVNATNQLVNALGLNMKNKATQNKKSPLTKVAKAS